jgi:hypothetical protein
MTFLPVVERELRVAARKRSTFWSRIAAAIVALIIATGFLALKFGAPSLGRGIFAVLTWLSLFAALSAGLFFTSDCLSEEKREGTMGLLFLTDLRGYDVALGKLLATSLRAFYSLLAVLPVLGLTLTLGGVTGAQFWKTALALVNALFLSLTTGLFVSAISRDSQKAMAGTLLLVLLLAVGGPLLDLLLAMMSGRFNPFLSVASPGYVFVTAGAWGRAPFWTALVINQFIAWTLLGLSCVLLPRTWQQRTEIRRTNSKESAFAEVRLARAASRRKLMGVNPVLWLASRERWPAVVVWIVAILTVFAAVLTLVNTAANAVYTGTWVLWNYLGGAVTLILYLAVTSHACRFFVETHRSGLIELLLATPLKEKQIVHGQWRALLRMFAVPLGIYLAVQLFAAVMAQLSWSTMTAATAPPPAAPATVATNATASNSTAVTTNTTIVVTTTAAGTTVRAPGSSGLPKYIIVAVASAATLKTAANFIALMWFGMWMGLNSRNSHMATLKTLLFVQVIPWFVVTFASSMLIPLLLMPRLMMATPGVSPQMIAWYPLLMSAVATVMYVAKDAGFLIWARRKLYNEFRVRASRTLTLSPPPASPPAALPPVIQLQTK